MNMRDLKKCSWQVIFIFKIICRFQKFCLKNKHLLIVFFYEVFEVLVSILISGKFTEHAIIMKQANSIGQSAALSYFCCCFLGL